MLKEVVWEDLTARPRMWDGDANSVAEAGCVGLLGLADHLWPHSLGRVWKELRNRVTRSGVVPGAKVYDHRNDPWG